MDDIMYGRHRDRLREKRVKLWMAHLENQVFSVTSLFLSALSPSFFLRSNELEARRTAKTDDPLLLSVYQKEMSGIFRPLFEPFGLLRDLSRSLRNFWKGFPW